MRRSSKAVVAGALAAALLAGAVVAYRHYDRREMIQVTREWARLAPFPEGASSFEISTEGGMASRAFRASFRASPSAIEKWLLDSPGTKEIEPDRSKPGVRRYRIVPGAGAQHAEVTVDDQTNVVQVYVYWS